MQGEEHNQSFVTFSSSFRWQYSTTAEFISKCKEGYDPKRAPTVSVCKVKSTTKVLSHLLSATRCCPMAIQLNSSPSAKKDTTPKSSNSICMQSEEHNQSFVTFSSSYRWQYSTTAEFISKCKEGYDPKELKQQDLRISPP